MPNKNAFWRRYPTKDEVLAKKAAEEKAEANKTIQHRLIERSKCTGAWQKIGALTDKRRLAESLDDHLLSYEPV